MLWPSSFFFLFLSYLLLSFWSSQASLLNSARAPPVPESLLWPIDKNLEDPLLGFYSPSVPSLWAPIALSGSPWSTCVSRPYSWNDLESRDYASTNFLFLLLSLVFSRMVDRWLKGEREGEGWHNSSKLCSRVTSFVKFYHLSHSFALDLYICNLKTHHLTCIMDKLWTIPLMGTSSLGSEFKAPSSVCL